MSQSLSLLPDSSDEDDNLDFKTDNDYAKKYDNWRNKEELQKLKDLTKDLSDSSSESDEEIIPQCEPDFFRVMSLSMSRDPKLHDKNVEFFKDEHVVVKKPKVKKEKPMFMKDYERKLVLEHNGVFSDEEEHIPTKGPTYEEEQDEIREGFKEFIQDSDNEDDLFKVRTLTKEQKVMVESDYKKWLETDPDMAHLNKVWNDPNLDEKEKFLRDYILNNGYENGENNDHIPNYAEITEDVTLSEDEKITKEQDMYEHKYNFRFEEPDQEFIKRYPRVIEDSLRRTENKRKLKREERAERKKREKEQKREDLKRLKALKRKEIEEKFLKLKEISGQEELNLDEIDLEGDFDPETHDQKMKDLFNDDYYTVDEIQKPEFSDEEEDDEENWDQWTRQKYVDNTSNENVYDDELQINDDVTEANEIQNFKQQYQEEMINAAQSSRKGRKKSLFAKVISQPKPVYDPDGKSFDEYLDEYYKLDYEDIIGDLPVRYKYRKVIPNDFGLSVEEILAAQDKELNKWCSVKKTFQYRRDEEEKCDVAVFRLKARNVFKKQRILSSVYSEPKEEEDPAEVKPKRKKKKYKKWKKGSNVQGTGSIENAESFSKEVVEPNEIKKVSKNFNNEAPSERSTELESPSFVQSPDNHKMADETAEGLPKNKSRKKSKKNRLQTGEEFTMQNGDSIDACAVDNSLAEHETAAYQIRDKKKKVKNHGIPLEENSQVYVSDASPEFQTETKSHKKSKQRKDILSENEFMSPSYDFDTSAVKNSSAEQRNVTFENTPKKKSKKKKANNYADISREENLQSEASSELSTKKASNIFPKQENLSTSIKFTHSSNQEEEGPRENEFSNFEHKTSRKASAEHSPKSKKKKKRGLEESVEENGSVETPVGNPPAKKIKREEFYNSSDKPELLFSGPGISKSGQKRKMKSKMSQESFHSHASEDKRLAVSNARLAAFGINPSKFKRSIIYNKN